MFFRIIGNRGQERFVRAKSNAEAFEISERLQKVKDMGKIKRFEHLKFERITPDEVLKSDNA